MEATMKKFVPPTKAEADKMYTEYEMGRRGKKPDGSPLKTVSKQRSN
jgi:hypothetical protein